MLSKESPCAPEAPAHLLRDPGVEGGEGSSGVLASAPVPGMFVTFEGLDGTGKSTHLKRCARWLRRQGIDVVETREPGGTVLGAAIRELFLAGRGAPVDGVVEALLVFAGRRQHLLELIEPALAAGRHVLCDRFTDSTLAYQGSGRGVSVGAIAELDRLATGGRVPDRTLLFDLDPAVARERGGAAGRGGAPDGPTRFDAEELDFYRRVREGYLELARREPRRFRVIDSHGPEEDTERQVRSALADLEAGARAIAGGAGGSG
jgi:dTMP kinase